MFKISYSIPFCVWLCLFSLTHSCFCSPSSVPQIISKFSLPLCLTSKSPIHNIISIKSHWGLPEVQGDVKKERCGSFTSWEKQRDPAYLPQSISPLPCLWPCLYTWAPRDWIVSLFLITLHIRHAWHAGGAQPSSLHRALRTYTSWHQSLFLCSPTFQKKAEDKQKDRVLRDHLYSVWLLSIFKICLLVPF